MKYFYSETSSENPVKVRTMRIFENELHLVLFLISQLNNEDKKYYSFNDVRSYILYRYNGIRIHEIFEDGTMSSKLVPEKLWEKLMSNEEARTHPEVVKSLLKE